MSVHRDERDAYASAQRAVARRLHPDLGGDPQQYVAAMAELERPYPMAPGKKPHGTPGRVHVVARHRVRTAVRVNTRLAVAALRGAVPRGWPGARRYWRL